MDETEFAPLALSRLAIVGLGLMGGSLALALKGRCARIVGIDCDPAVVERAREREAVDFATTDLAAGIRGCDLIVLAVPVRGILGLISDLRLRAEGSLEGAPTEGRPASPTYHLPITILDLGSTKAAVTEAMAALPEQFDPIGGHPMCGKEVAGLEHADADLFGGRTFALTPLARTTARARGLARELAEAIGSRPLEISAQTHDALVAVTSHLPYVVAAALMRAAASLGDERVWELAASGFRDTSRLAASDLTMMVDILVTNRTAILDALARYRAELDSLAALIERGEPDVIRDTLAEGQQRRAGMFKD